MSLALANEMCAKVTLWAESPGRRVIHSIFFPLLSWLWMCVCQDEAIPVTCRAPLADLQWTGSVNRKHSLCTAAKVVVTAT